MLMKLKVMALGMLALGTPNRTIVHTRLRHGPSKAAWNRCSLACSFRLLLCLTVEDWGFGGLRDRRVKPGSENLHCCKRNLAKAVSVPKAFKVAWFKL